MRRTFAVLVAIFLAAVPAMAQGHHGARADSSRGMGTMQGMHGQCGMMGMMGGVRGQGERMGMMPGIRGQGGMMGGGMMAGPMMILRLEESLDLSERQVERLETIQESAPEEVRQHMMQGMRAMHGAQMLLDGESPDLADYEAKLREGMNHMVRAHRSRAEAGVAARQVLSAAQREKLVSVRAAGAAAAAADRRTADPSPRMGRMQRMGRLGRMGAMHRRMMGGGSTGEAPETTAVTAAAAGCPDITQELTDRGRDVFSGAGACGACHGGGATGSQLAPNLTDARWLNVDGSYGGIAEVVGTGVAQPKEYPAPMPPMGGANLSAEQVCAVAAYVYSLSH